MHEYSVVIEVWYDAEDQEDANKAAKYFCSAISHFTEINSIEIEGEPESNE